MSPKYVKRVTLFKIPKEEDIDAVLSEYQVMRATAQKVAFDPSMTSFDPERESLNGLSTV